MNATLKSGDLIDRTVIERNTTAEIGQVEQMWFDPAVHRVVGVTCKSGWLGRTKHSFAWEQVETIGADSILINAPDRSDLKIPESAYSKLGHELLTDAGNKAGKLVGYCFDPKTGEVTDYLFVSNGWRGVTDGTYRLSPTAVVSMGSQRAIAVDAMVQDAEQYAEGLAEKLDRATEFLKEDYAKTRQELATAVEGTQTIADQVQEKTQQVASQAQETLAAMKEKLQRTESSTSVDTSAETSTEEESDGNTDSGKID